MSPEAQRIAIAEACGWRIYESNGITYYERPGGDVYNHVLCVECLPDYCSDLNAMHEAEAGLGEGQKMPYARKLLEIVTGCPPHLIGGFLNGGTLWDAVFATAAQRAEAFLKTLNLWPTASSKS